MLGPGATIFGQIPKCQHSLSVPARKKKIGTTVHFPLPLFSRLLPASIGKAQTAKKRGAEKFATSVDMKVNGITKASKVW